MKLSLKGLALAAGILWALALFLTGVMNLIWPPYGEAFLKMMASVYPGYHAARSIGGLVVGTLYAFSMEPSAVWFSVGSTISFLAGKAF